MSDLMAEMLSHIVEMKGALGGVVTKVDGLCDDVCEMKKAVSNEHTEIHDRIDTAYKDIEAIKSGRNKFLWTAGGICTGAGVASTQSGKIINAILMFFMGGTH